jgi:hypothetical protein
MLGNPNSGFGGCRRECSRGRRPGTDSPRREDFHEGPFLAGLAAREVKSLTADLQAGPKVVPGGTEIMVIEVNELEGKVRIELLMSAGAGRYWVTARQLATALGT